MTRWIELAHKLAIQAGRHRSVLVGALAVRGGALLDKEANFTRGVHSPLHRGHAEERLLKRLGERARGATLYVVRDSRRMSRPCPNCWRLCVEHEINRVVYLTVDGIPVVERVR